MNKQTSNLVSLESAENMLEKAYKADTAASYHGRFMVNGPAVNAKINQVDRDGLPPKFEVTVKSTIFSEITLNEIIQ